MKVYSQCKKCKAEISYSTHANTRVEFAMYDGETKELSCTSCRTVEQYHADELYAKPSKIAQIGASLIFLIGTPLVIYGLNPVFTSTRNPYSIYIIGSFFLVPVVVYALIKKQDQNRVNAFNRSNLRGRVR